MKTLEGISTFLTEYFKAFAMSDLHSIGRF